MKKLCLIGLFSFSGLISIPDFKSLRSELTDLQGKIVIQTGIVKKLEEKSYRHPFYRPGYVLAERLLLDSIETRSILLAEYEKALDDMQEKIAYEISVKRAASS